MAEVGDLVRVPRGEWGIYEGRFYVDGVGWMDGVRLRNKDFELFPINSLVVLLAVRKRPLFRRITLK